MCPKNPKTRDKIKKTNLEKYGVESILQDRNKMKYGMEEKYGVEYAGQSKEIKEKIKQTWIENYGVDNPNKNSNVREKIEQTNLEKYGSKVVVPFGSDRYKKIIYEKYGIEYQKLPEFSEKLHNTWNNKTQKELDEITNKRKKTMLEKYGIEYANQNKTFFEKALLNFKKRYSIKKYNNIKYQSKFELALIKFCEENNIQIKNGPSIKYKFKDKNKIYHIDFETNEYIIEIKGKHKWYFDDLKSGKLEAKNKAAQQHAAISNKTFKFILADSSEDYFSLFSSIFG